MWITLSKLRFISAASTARFRAVQALFVVLGGAVVLVAGAVPSRAAGLSVCVTKLQNQVVQSFAKVTKSEIVAAANGLPQHCSVIGTTGAGNRRNIRFNLRMPTRNWNGKFFFQGGAGTDGFLNDAVGKLQGNQEGTALGHNYAVVSTDSGHNSESLPTISTNIFGLFNVVTEFGRDYELRVDYGYRAIELVTIVAKALINDYYGSPPEKSFFVGCSNGGRSAFEAAVRFSSEFDGILAGAPAIAIANQIMQAADDAKILASFSWWPGLPGKAFSRNEMRMVAQTVRTQCDELDGVADNYVADWKRCQEVFNPEVMLCTDWQISPVCLDSSKLTALKKMIAGVKTSAGTPVYAPFAWDPGLGTTDLFSSWSTWRLRSFSGFLAGWYPYPIMSWLGGGMLAEVISTPPLPFDGTSGDAFRFLKAYNIDTGYANLTVTNTIFLKSAQELYNVPDPTTSLAAFRDRGGKMMVFTGSADPTVSVHHIVNWYNGLTEQDTKAGKHTTNYARLYVIPGMNHCSGGPATDKFDLFSALEQWVDKPAEQPKTVIASVANGNDDFPKELMSTSMQRPLCAYPSVARFAPVPNSPYDIVSAKNFVCK